MITQQTGMSYRACDDTDGGFGKLLLPQASQRE
jgi:hypothetical protein